METACELLDRKKKKVTKQSNEEVKQHTHGAEVARRYGNRLALMKTIQNCRRKISIVEKRQVDYPNEKPLPMNKKTVICLRRLELPNS